MRLLVVILVAAVAACGGSVDGGTTTALPDAAPTTVAGPPVPRIPTGPVDADLAAALDAFFAGLASGADVATVAAIGDSGDVRLAWVLADLLRFLAPGPDRSTVIEAFSAVSGVELAGDGSAWVKSTNLLMGWDVPAPPGYREWKQDLFTAIDERWGPVFDDPTALDYRLLGWGGVLPDDRPFGETEIPCVRGCIPAIDFPEVTDVEGGAWYPDDGVVLGVTIGGESRAYPRNVMEVHEMVIDRVGNVLIGMPYCTLCGTAAAFDLESVPDGVETPVLRTSGLLVRSNKLMYDLVTGSTFDMFSGEATSGPLLAAGTTLDRITVVTSTWGAWKAEHPDTTIVARDGGIGRVYPDDPLGGRDDDGPIFPIGPVDPRLPVQTQVLGVEYPAGAFVAFPADEARRALQGGQTVAFGDVVVVLDGDGLRAETTDGLLLATSQSFWFAWSQFHPGTEVWHG